MVAGWLRPQQAASYLSVTKPTIYMLLRTGVLKSKRVGGCRLISRESLDLLGEVQP